MTVESLPFDDAADTIECPACHGAGGTTYTTEGCCEDYLPTGECCAAQYGTARLVPIVEIDPCSLCDGTGRIES